MTPDPAPGTALPTEVTRDRNSFVAAIPATRTGPSRAECAAILDDLIRWGQEQHPAIEFAPRAADRKQCFVTYSLPDGNTFWQAYPHGEDGARLYLTCSRLLPDRVLTALRDRFAEMSTPPGPKTGTHPTLAFGDMVSAADRAKVLVLLGRALASVAGTTG